MLLALTKLLVSISILMCFFGCEQAQVDEATRKVGEESQDTTVTTPTRKNPVLGFSQLGSESQWRLANSLSIKISASESDVELNFQNAEQSQGKQIEAIREFISKKVDVIAIAPVVETDGSLF